MLKVFRSKSDNVALLGRKRLKLNYMEGENNFDDKNDSNFK